MSNSHSQISFTEWREFYRNTKKSLSSEVREISDYIRAYISDVLSSPGKETFTREDFTRMKKYTENLVPYMEVLKEFWKDSPILLWRLLHLCKSRSAKKFRSRLQDTYLEYMITNLSEQKLLYVLSLYRIWSVKALKNFSRNHTLLRTLMLIPDEYFSYITWSHRSRDDFEKLSENRIFAWFKRDSQEIFKIICSCCTSVWDFQKLDTFPYLNGTLRDVSVGSEILHETLVAYLRGDDIHTFIREQASTFLASLPEQDARKIPQRKLALSIYFRLWWKVNYPEIGEAVIVFMQEYLEKFWSFTNIRIIPRFPHLPPSQVLYDDIVRHKHPMYANIPACDVNGGKIWKKTQFYHVAGETPHQQALYGGAVACILSHSTHPWNGEIPTIVSRGTEPQEGDIVLPIELESHHQWYKDITTHITLGELFHIIFQALQEIEGKLENIPQDISWKNFFSRILASIRDWFT